MQACGPWGVGNAAANRRPAAAAASQYTTHSSKHKRLATFITSANQHQSFPARFVGLAVSQERSWCSRNAPSSMLHTPSTTAMLPAGTQLSAGVVAAAAAAQDPSYSYNSSSSPHDFGQQPQQPQHQQQSEPAHSSTKDATALQIQTHGEASLPTGTAAAATSSPRVNSSAGGDGMSKPSSSSSPLWPLLTHQWRKRVCTFILENFMLLSFTLAAALAIAWPLPGKVVASWAVGDVRVVQALNNFLVFLISGLTLKSDDFRALLRHWVGVLYGLVAILAITPCFAFLMIMIPFQPKDFATGLALFCIVPTTLGVGVALTAASKGNQALALLLTVVTNLLGIVTVPYELRLVLSTASVSTVSVDPANLVVKLLLTVLVPSVLGKVARELSKHVQAFVTKFKTQLSLFSTLNLACIVWQTLSGARETLLQQPFTSVLLIIVASSLLHVIMLLFNGAVVRWILRLPFREGVAVLIMSSQKSAPVAVTVISYLTPSLTQQGLMAIPCIIGQLGQIFIGSALAKYLRRRADKGL